jgi:hypothetical protein
MSPDTNQTPVAIAGKDPFHCGSAFGRRGCQERRSEGIHFHDAQWRAVN